MPPLDLTFYKNIQHKPLQSVFTYMVEICITVALVTAVFIATLMFVNNTGPSLAVELTVSFISVFLAIAISMFVGWLLYGFVLGILIMLCSMIIKKRVSYVVSVKTGLYVMSLGMIFVAVPAVAPISFFGEILSIVIVLANSKSIFKFFKAF